MPTGLLAKSLAGSLAYTGGSSTNHGAISEGSHGAGAERCKLHGQRIDLFDLLDHLKIAGDLRPRLRIEDMGDRERDRGGVQRLAVVKRDVRSQPDLPGQRIDLGHRLGQHHLQRPVRPELHERIVDRVDDRPAVRLIDQRRIERRRLHGKVDRQLLAALAGVPAPIARQAPGTRPLRHAGTSNAEPAASAQPRRARPRRERRSPAASGSIWSSFGAAASPHAC